ncbi:Polyphosphate kinase [Planctomycetes bacterium Pan216]|uniref:Polyphosphate kinase n=1 Tax=Kolteria novifilia TaxID=2527975 RepID=A0A518B7Q1_9BACT|nr:Polyphosphate kinase [Planctomycetes bacterium Pan216]
MAVDEALKASWLSAYEDRDISWLQFCWRVLHEASDDRTPLLEKVKYLAIMTSLVDEFFMKRIGVLKRRSRAGLAARINNGVTIQQHLNHLRELVIPILDRQAEVFEQDVRPELARHGILVHRCWNDLTDDQRREASEFFHRSVFPMLTPLAVDPGHPFPFLANLSTSLGVVLKAPNSPEEMFARVKVPDSISNWISLSSDTNEGQFCFISLHEIIRHNLQSLFPGMEVVDAVLFRVSRNADVEVDEDEADSLRDAIAEEVQQRRFEPIIRLQHQPSANKWVLEFLIRQFGLSESDVYESPSELDFQGLFAVAGLGVPELSDEPWVPVTSPSFADDEVDMFSVIRNGDVLVHHPYESFDTSVERFIRTASEDPDVRAIKMTIYRVGDDTPFVRSLIRAAEAGKQVACLVEVKARFDEETNLRWAQALEKVGVHVVYGIVGLKTHTKLALVVREDPDGLRCYAHIGTGNYHVKTAKLYVDLGLFTADPEITDDVVNVFHYLTGRSLKDDYNQLLVAPSTMRTRFLEMIDREIEHAEQGRPARFIAKMNQLEDPDMCQAIVKGSQAGVQIDLFVRGFCCLRPGVEGATENVRITSIIGRFLEHSRIFWFQNGAEDPLEGDFFIGSADWMNRNLSGRVEAVTPVKVRQLRERLWSILDIMLNDHRQAWEMRSDGSYVQRAPSPDAEGPYLLGTHKSLMDLARSKH